jgi:hypothetical protein
MINSNLLREAIADARAVRTTAYANAKASLQERFDKRFEAVFAEKLKNESEEEEEQEEGLQEVEAPNQIHGAGGEAKGPSTKPVSKGQPKIPGSAAGDKDFKAVQAGLGPKGVPKLGKKVNETAEDGSEPEEWGVDEASGLKKMSKGGNDKFKSMGHNKPTGRYAENAEESGFSSEDLDEIIQELEAEVAGEEEGQRVEEPTFPPRPNADANDADNAAGEADSDAVDADVAAGEADADAEMPGAGSEEDAEVDIAHDDADVAGAEAGEADTLAGDADAEADVAGPVPPQFGQQPPQFPSRSNGEENQEEIGLEELLAALNEEAKEEEEEDEKGKEMDEITNNGLPPNSMPKKATVRGWPEKAEDSSDHQVKGKNHNISGPPNWRS